MWKLNLLMFVFFCLIENSMACWAAPQEEVWVSPGDQAYQYKRDNTNGIVTITSATDRTNVLWSAKLQQFDGLFSMIYVVRNGNVIIHLRSNHQVGSVDDLAMEVIYKQGERQTYAAASFVEALLKPDPRAPQMSAAPRSRWIKSVTEVNDDHITLLTTSDKEVVVDLRT